MQVDGEEMIDTYEQQTTWMCTYIRLLDAPVFLPMGARIRCLCHVDASTHCPRYSVSVSVAPTVCAPLQHVADFAWEGCG